MGGLTTGEDSDALHDTCRGMAIQKESNGYLAPVLKLFETVLRQASSRETPSELFVQSRDAQSRRLPSKLS